MPKVLDCFKIDDPNLQTDIILKLLSKSQYASNNVRYLGIVDRINSTFFLQGPYKGTEYGTKADRDSIKKMMDADNGFTFLLYNNGKGWCMTDYDGFKISKQFVNKLCSIINLANSELVETSQVLTPAPEVTISPQSYTNMIKRLEVLEKKLSKQEDHTSQRASVPQYIDPKDAPPPYDESEKSSYGMK